MCNCNFEVINQILNKKMKKKIEMEYGPFICTTNFYLIPFIIFRKELLMLNLGSELLVFSCDFLVIVVCRYNYDLDYKDDNFFQLLKVIFNILYTKSCLDQLFYAASTFVCFLQSKQVQIISETKLNHVNIKATRGYNRL